jgi:hypothetical protein
MDVTILSHSGLGDNIAMIGAVYYLLNIYNNIYFLCKETHLKNLNILYSHPRIFLISFKPENEYHERFHLLIPKYKTPNMDVLISGSYHKNNFISKIKNKKMFEITKNNNFNITERFNFIKDFYEDIKLDLSFFYNYFNINSTEKSLLLYNNIKNYNIIFLHTQSSNNTINLNKHIDEFIQLEDYILICPNHNFYSHDTPKYQLAKLYIDLLIPDYIDIIYNSKYIYIIDSCFSTIIIPLIYTKKINPINCKIFNREDLTIILDIQSNNNPPPPSL